MITCKCDECNKEVRRGSICVISCSIKPNKYKYISTIKVTGYNNSINKAPSIKICKDCMRYYYDSLHSDEVKDLISLELLSLITGKAKRIQLCKALEDGNGK